MRPVVELGPAKTVFRLVRETLRFIPEGARLPTGEAFEPSDEEKTDAVTSGDPVRVSVWDMERTTIMQAKAVRQTRDPMKGYALPVAYVIRIREQLRNERLRVVEDPLPNLVDVPGGDGHCGIEGLDRKAGEQRRDHKVLLDELAQNVHPIEEPPA